MFEKEAEEQILGKAINSCPNELDMPTYCQGFSDGYHECQKEHEWHFVKDGDLPKGEYTENEKVYAIFKNNSYYIVDRAAVKNYDDLIAWTELPKLPTELSKKWVDNYEDYQNASNDITFSQYPVYRGK